MQKSLRLGSIVFALCAVGPAVQAQTQEVAEHVIIDTPKPYTNVVSAIQNLGGKVNRQFEYIDAIAADIPSSAMPAVRDLVGKDAISKDDIIAAPKPVRRVHKQVLIVQDNLIYTVIPVGASVGKIFPVKQPSDVPPEKAYAVNDANLKIRDLHAAGYTGKDVIVAVVDTGVRPNYASLDLDGSVIGGQDFVGDGNNFSSPLNDPHGTFVAGLISGNARFPVLGTSATSVFINSMDHNFPGTLEKSKDGTFVDVIGSAPEAKIYAIRVFGVGASAGAPKSRVIAALESVIKLRDNGLNIKVCNMSFGTSTTFSGHSELERLLDTMIAKDIVPVVSAGNAGPSTLTISSPATSFSGLPVGATSPAANERLLNDFFDYSSFGCTGPCGAFYRPSDHIQTALFSSRGPTADGRILPEVMAAGNGMLSQGCGGFDNSGDCVNDVNNLTMGSGTSFSAPVVSGIAAVLRQKFPKASAGQIWNAIVNAADHGQLGNDSTVLDQGQGVVNATAAADLIQNGKVSDRLPAPPKPDSLVSNNIEDNTNLRVFSGTVSQKFNNLEPGQRAEVLYQVDPDTSQVVINLTNIKLAANQNKLFGDDVFLNIQTAKTSSGGFGDYFTCANGLFITGNTDIVIPDPSCLNPDGTPAELLEPGVMRITLIGDTTNAGNVSASVSVTSSKTPLARGANGQIDGGDNLFFTVIIPSGTSATPPVSQAIFELRWVHDWGYYPTNDLDMYITPPLSSVENGSGATLNSPESVIVPNPTPGIWKIRVSGFSVPTGNDKFVLSVLLDGKAAPVKYISGQ